MFRKLFAKIWTRGGRVAAILLLLSGSAFGAFQVGLGTTSVKASDFPQLSLAGVQRLLVLAPHPDDETLAAGGLIQAATRAGIQVRVVIATNGDGSRSTAVAYLHAVRPSAQDYLRMGRARQQESLAALKLLGVGSGQVDFLSFPDRGTPFLWAGHWSSSSPYRSPFTHQTRSAYPLTFDKAEVYSGQDYLSDLTAILDAYRPDLVVYPHPEDIHPDHWGLNVFTRLALTTLEAGDPTYRPRQYTYLVHRNDYPVVRGYRPTSDLVPPPPLYAISHTWVRFDLTPQQEVLKYAALQEYRSQLPTLRGLMDSFDRTNELFAPVVDSRLTAVTAGTADDPATWAQASGQRLAAIQPDPVHDVLMRTALSSADLVAVYAARGPQDALWLCTESDDPTTADIDYIIHLKLLTAGGVADIGAQTLRPPKGWQKADRAGVYACTQFGLAQLGNPYAVYVGALTQGPDGLTIDQTAWQMVWVDPQKAP